MGSDMHMSPPTPDENRAVRCGGATAVYVRHTDGIYGDTKTWTRTYLNLEDYEGAAFDALKKTIPRVKVVSLPPNTFLAPTMEFDALAVADRDWEVEEAELVSKVHRAEERAARVYEDVVSAKMALEKFRSEKGA